MEIKKNNTKQETKISNPKMNALFLKTTKNLILITWIVLLTSIGLITVYTNNIFRQIKSTFQLTSFQKKLDCAAQSINSIELENNNNLDLKEEKIFQSLLIYKNCFHLKEGIPPIESILYDIYNDLDLTKDFKLRDYIQLYIAIETRLEAKAIAPSENQDLNTIKNDIIPPQFRKKEFKEQDIDLSLEVKNWISQESERNKLITGINSVTFNLLNTFILLIILGGFGSLIFLTREHLENEEKIPIKAYIYKPLLGMFLAIASFIANISVHTLVSESEIQKIRRETLLLVAFSAGLISEQAYSAITEKAKKALTSKEKNPPQNESENQNNPSIPEKNSENPEDSSQSN